MIIEFENKYEEDVKELLLELQKYLADIDKEGYNIVGKNFKEEYYKKTIETVNKCKGKILLYKEKDEIAGLVIGVINNNETEDYEFKAPKRGRVTELIVKEKYRGSHIGSKLLDSITDYLKSIGCNKIMIAVFGYNDNAISFYKKNGYHIRMIDMIED